MVYGAVIGGEQIQGQFDNPDSQNFYDIGDGPVIRGTNIISEKIETLAQGEAAAQSLLNQRSFVVQMGELSVIGFETLRAGQLVTLSGFTGAPDGTYLVIEKRHIVPPGITILKVAAFMTELEEIIISLIKRMREREKEVIDDTITPIKFINTFESTDSVDTIVTIEKEALNNTFIVGHAVNGVVGRGFLAVDGEQIIVGRNTTITQLIP